MDIEKNKVRVIDNFLCEDDFYQLKNTFLDKKFPWYFNDCSVYDDDNCPQFCHAIYMDMEPVSYCWEYVKPILVNELELKNHQSILRVKVNATPSSSSIIQKGFHYDLVEPGEKAKIKEDYEYAARVCPHNVAIIYINTNDGYTYFKDGTKIESIENRCIIFPGNLMHAGSTCTDSPLRVVLNVNYTCE